MLFQNVRTTIKKAQGIKHPQRQNVCGDGVIIFLP